MLVTACIGLGCNILNLITLNFCCNAKDDSGNGPGLFDSVASAYKPFYGRFTHKKVRYDDHMSDDLDVVPPTLAEIKEEIDGQNEPLLGDLESNTHSAKKSIKSNGLNETNKAESTKQGKAVSKHSQSQHGEVHDTATESVEPMSPGLKNARSYSVGDKQRNEKNAKSERDGEEGIIIEEV